MTNAMTVLAGWWTSGIFGKVCVVAVAVYGVMAMTALILWFIVWMDRRYVSRHKTTGTIGKKYIMLPGEDGCLELEDSNEARSMSGVCFMLEIHCEGCSNFQQAVKKDLFDRFEIGDQMLVMYKIRHISGATSLVEMPATARKDSYIKGEAVW
jgi:hypothetical protein